MPTPADTTGLILAGGRSRRFGRDKALAVLDGVSFVEHVARALRPHVAELLVATGSTPRCYPVDARVVLDPVPDGGPLAGLAAGLEAATTPWLLAAAVDLPYLTHETLAPLTAAASAPVDVVIGREGNARLQPVCALWRVATVAPIVREHLACRRRALHALLDRLVVHDVALPPELLRNVNDPEDVQPIRSGPSPPGAG